MKWKDECFYSSRSSGSESLFESRIKIIQINLLGSQLNPPWAFYISPDKVPWGIRNLSPWDFTMFSTIAHDGVLAGKCRNFPGQLRVTPTGLLLQVYSWVVYSVPHGTLSEGFTVLLLNLKSPVSDVCVCIHR
jgi:hypothetical protein